VTLRRLGPPIVLVATVLVVWELYCRASGVSPVVLPAPSRIVDALWTARADVVRHTLPTLGETAIGLLVSISVAVVVAVVMDRFETIRRAVQPLLVASQTIPIVAIAPLLVIWFGFDLAPKVLVVVLVTFFPIVVALLAGFAATPAEASDLLESFGASRAQAFSKLRWPGALPSLFTGLRIAVTYGVIGAVFGEYVGAYEGLGIWMQLSQNAFRVDLVFGAIVVTAVLSLALFAMVVLAERLLIPWYAASRKTG
jgi:ABC-type nitrate/sulfonate/bicarbonate transport system permease component